MLLQDQYRIVRQQQQCVCFCQSDWLCSISASEFKLSQLLWIAADWLPRSVLNTTEQLMSIVAIRCGRYTAGSRCRPREDRRHK